MIIVEQSKKHKAIYIDSIIFYLILIDLRKFAESLPESDQRFIRRTGHTTITSFRPNYS